MRGNPTPPHIPTPAEITRYCRELQAGWSEKERQRRSGEAIKRVECLPVGLDEEALGNRGNDGNG